MTADHPHATAERSALRVLTYLNSFDPGGVERVALRLNAAWRAQGVLPLIIVGRETGLARHAAPDLDYAPLLDGSRWHHRWPLLGLVIDLPGAIRRHRPHILFCAGNTYSFAMLLVWLRLGRDCPPIVAKISNDLARADQPWMLRALYHVWLKIQGRFIHHFVGMAPPMRPEIRAFCGVPDARITIINDPVLLAADVERFAQLAAARRPDGSGHRFLAIGRLSPQKNFALLLDAFARMARTGDRLTILGEGPDRAALETQAARLGIAGQLAMPGFVARLDPWLAAADALVMSSDYEGVPAAIIEAIAAGLPVIATDCSVSMAELTGQGHFGVLVPVGDGAALAAAMAAFSGTKPDAAAARAHVEAFTVEQGAADYARLMATLVAPAAQ